jgi:hypothetical protein
VQQPEQEFMHQSSSVKGKEKVEQSVPKGKGVQSNVVNEVVKIGSNDVVMGDCFQGPVVINSPSRAQNGNNSGPS